MEETSDSHDRAPQSSKAARAGNKQEGEKGRSGNQKKPFNRGKNYRGQQDWGGQGSRASWGARGPLLFGLPPEPTLQSCPPAKGCAEQCLLCCEKNPSYMSIGRCKHPDICWVCSLRLRAHAGDRRCPVCKEDLAEVIFTNDTSIPLEGAGQGYFLDESCGVRFIDEHIRQEVSKLLDYRCSLGQCSRRMDSCFKTIGELEDHLWWVHWRKFCKTCLHGRPAFLCEQLVYEERDMSRHCKEGDREQSMGKWSTPPVQPHAYCEFCRDHHFNEDELLRHMHHKHHLCCLCERMGRRHDFYASWRCLALHYQEKHFVCAHKDCQRGGHRLIAFIDEEELDFHFLTEHSDSRQAADRGTKLRLQVGHVSYAEQQRARGKGQGKGSGNDGQRADTQVHFAWPSGATNDDLFDDPLALGEEWSAPAEADDAEVDRYPEREISERTSSRGDTWKASKKDNPKQQHDRADADAEHNEDADDDDDHDRDFDADAEIDADGDADGQHKRDPGGSGEPCGQSNSPSHNDKESKAQDSSVLDPRLETLCIGSIMAEDGPRCGCRSSLNALNAVLRALVGEGAVEKMGTDTEWRAPLRATLERLTATELEGLERMRAHLDDGNTCDWEPIERILALRPLFFLLLTKTHQAPGGASSVRQRETIGPRPDAAEDTAAWRKWKLAAQAAVFALGLEARQRLAMYVHLCIQRRAQLFAYDTGESKGGLVEFPTLRSGEDASPHKETSDRALAWSDKHQAAQNKVGKDEFPSLGGEGTTQAQSQHCQGSTWTKSNNQAGTISQSPHEFPGLGPESSTSKAHAGSTWGPSSGAAGAAGEQIGETKLTLEQWARPKNQVVPQATSFDGVTESAFPSLAPGQGPKPTSKACEDSKTNWGASGRAQKELAVSAASAAKPDADVSISAADPAPAKKAPAIEEITESTEHFPGLPSAPKKPAPKLSSGGQADKKRGAKHAAGSAGSKAASAKQGSSASKGQACQDSSMMAANNGQSSHLDGNEMEAKFASEKLELLVRDSDVQEVLQAPPSTDKEVEAAGRKKKGREKKLLMSFG